MNGLFSFYNVNAGTNVQQHLLNNAGFLVISLRGKQKRQAKDKPRCWVQQNRDAGEMPQHKSSVKP